MILLLGVLLANYVLSWVGVVPAPRFALDIFTGAAFAGAFRLHLGARPGRIELAATLAVAAALCAILATRGSVELLEAGLLACGGASLAVLVVRLLFARRGQRRPIIDTLALVALLPLFVLIARSALYLTGLHHETYDGTAFHVDAALGGQASFYLGKLFRTHLGLEELCGAAYGLLPLAIAMLAVAEARRPERPRASILDAAVLAGIAGFILYHACPVCGPVYRFGDLFPFGTPSHVRLVSGVADGFPRNGMPSLHTAWVLLLYWHGKRCGTDTWIFAGVWLVLTELATLGLGEHYLIDLVVAVPFAVAVEAAATLPEPESRTARRDALLAGSGLTFASILLLRWAPFALTASEPATWAFVLATVAVPLALHVRMQKRVGVEASAASAPLADPGEAP